MPQRGSRLIGRFFHHPAWRVPWLMVTGPLAAWLLHALALWLWHIPALFDAALNDSTVHAWQHASFLLTALLFGLAPAWHMSRLGQNYEQLKEGSRSDTEGHHRQRLRGLLVAAQVALALILLVGAGLFLKSLGKLRDVDTGFQPHGVASASVALPPVQYSAEDKQAAFFHSVLEKLSSTPGVRKAAVIEPLPFSGDDSSASFQIEGRIDRSGDPGPHGKPGRAHRAVAAHLAVRPIGIDIAPRVSERTISSR